MGTYFSNPASSIPNNKNDMPDAVGIGTINSTIRNPSFLQFLGNAVNKGKTYVLLKDTNSDKIIKIELNGVVGNRASYSVAGTIILHYEGKVYELAM